MQEEDGWCPKEIRSSTQKPSKSPISSEHGTPGIRSYSAKDAINDAPTPIHHAQHPYQTKALTGLFFKHKYRDEYVRLGKDTDIYKAIIKSRH